MDLDINQNFDDFEEETEKDTEYELVQSTEFIPDEYPHDTKNGLVHIFASPKDQGNLQRIKTTLESLDYEIPNCNIHPINKEEEIANDLGNIANGNHDDKTCLIIFFLGNYMVEPCDHIFLPEDHKMFYFKNIWSRFLSSKSFVNKPKIFIVQATLVKDKYSTDNMGPKGEESIPAEGDICVVYNKLNGRDEDLFIENFCENIKSFGKRDDLFDLILRSKIKQFVRPVIISTFTRKFYFVPNTTRGCHYDIENSMQNIEELVKQMRKKQTTPDVFSSISHDNFLDITGKKEMGKSCPSLDNNSQENMLPDNVEMNAGRSRSASVAEFSLEPMTPRPRLNSKTKKKMAVTKPVFKF